MSGSVSSSGCDTWYSSLLASLRSTVSIGLCASGLLSCSISTGVYGVVFFERFDAGSVGGDNFGPDD